MEIRFISESSANKLSYTRDAFSLLKSKIALNLIIKKQANKVLMKKRNGKGIVCRDGYSVKGEKRKFNFV